jgi:hypothetical protein
MTNLYYNTVKMLLERISSVMVDHQALKVMILFDPFLILVAILPRIFSVRNCVTQVYNFFFTLLSLIMSLLHHQ